MTRPERYEELRQQGRFPVDCTDPDKPRKLLGSVGKNGDVWFYCDRCHRDHRLSWEKLLVHRQKWEREQGRQDSDTTALRAIVNEVSVLVVSDNMVDLAEIQRRARELLGGSGAA